MLIDKIQELTIPRVVQMQVRSIICYIEGHTVTECPRLRGIGPPPHPIMPPLVGPSGGLTQVSTIVPFHGSVQYHAF